MSIKGLSNVERAYFDHSGRGGYSSKIPYIIVKNFPDLGLLTALRFIEWVAENPKGVISLPTGKTPEYFIKWTKRLLDGWDNKENHELMEKNGLSVIKKPSLRGLHFVQIDEFYPIDPRQHNSFYDYVNNYYIKGFDLDPAKALLINSDEIILSAGKHFSEVFPDSRIDLTLRNREALTPLEKLQQASIFSIDNWCTHYENRIRELGGIGFFLGGIGLCIGYHYGVHGTQDNNEHNHVNEQLHHCETTFLTCYPSVSHQLTFILPVILMVIVFSLPPACCNVTVGSATLDAVPLGLKIGLLVAVVLTVTSA